MRPALEVSEFAVYRSTIFKLGRQVGILFLLPVQEIDTILRLNVYK